VRVDGPGIQRRKAGKGFSYIGPDDALVRDEAVLARIHRIAVPPAWTEVWIAEAEDAHIQAVGRDAAGRRQYRYHPEFRRRRDTGKFDRLIRFGEALPRIRRRVRRDLAVRGLPREKVLAAVVSLLELTSLRVGNPEYAALNKSFGLSTLRDRHARISGSTIRLRFRGKGGRMEERTVIDRRLATVVRNCQELPGQELFQYQDGDEIRAISSEDVNAYIRDAAGDAAFSAKDFRTWTATVHAFRELRAGLDDTGTRRGRSRLNEALRRTADALGDTLSVTRASYVHPGVLAAFESDPTDILGRRRAAAALARPASRDDELELLGLLKRANRARPAARTSKVGGSTRRARATRSRA
jgi:DNA topoisomerase-1